ncbi:hypothetical protein ACU686_17335 [Yinghuangia aomiensis]
MRTRRIRPGALLAALLSAVLLAACGRRRRFGVRRRRRRPPTTCRWATARQGLHAGDGRHRPGLAPTACSPR